jgi:hypothetical protein
MRRRWIVSAATVAIAAASASGKFKQVPEAPVKRLLANLARHLEKAPDDPHLLYLAGRTHAIAYAQGEDAKAHVESESANNKEDVLPVFWTRRSDLLRFTGEADAVRFDHLREGVRLLRRAGELATVAADPKPESDDDRPLLFLGLAWLLDDGSRFAPRLGHPEGVEPKDALPEAERAAIDVDIARLGAKEEGERDAAYAALRKSLPRCWPRLVANAEARNETVRAKVGELLTRWWRDLALDAYRRTLELTSASDLKDHGLEGTFTISREAANAVLRLLDDFPDRDTAKKERAAVEAHLKRLDERDRGGFAITPMIFPIARDARLAELFPDGRTSAFDVAGDGVARRWPWPSADAGFLVWAPDPSKPVASGRQLFGSRTWWIFWRDGYEPLSMLDDDGDGRLSGAELDGVCVWRDADRDGVCGEGELKPVADYRIAWIAVASNGTEDGVPANDRGIGFVDGETRPTYDWTPRSVPEAPVSR